jgi:hypothetical protein
MENLPIIIYNTADGKANVTLFARDGSVWMNQNQLAELFDTSKQNIGQHIANILEEKELDENSVVKNYLTTAADGKQYEAMKQKVKEVYTLFDQRRKTAEAQAEDAQELEELRALSEVFSCETTTLYFRPSSLKGGIMLYGVLPLLN